MGVKIKKRGLRIDATLVADIKREFKSVATRDYKAEMLAAIKDLISKGISPVKGYRRFAPYSPSYKEAIDSGRFPGKSKRPVNMTLSGKMMDSLDIRVRGENAEISFTDEKAVYHNDLGAGKAQTIRRLLPTNNGEVFTKVIDDKIVEALELSIENVKRKGSNKE